MPTAAASTDSELAYRTLVETSHDLIWSVDAKGRWTFVNDAAVRRIYGYKPAEMLGRPFTDFQTPEQAAIDLKAFAKIKAGTPFFNYETVHRRKDGSPVWLNFNAVMVLDDQGKVVGTTGTAQDITERKRAELALRESESKFRAIIEASPVPYALNDEGQNITYLNAAFSRKFGYEREDIPTLSDWWPKAYPDAAYANRVKTGWEERLNKSKKAGTQFEPMELNIRCKDGTSRTVLANAVPLGASFQGVHLVILYDITERKQAEAALVAGEVLLQQFVKHTPAAVAMLDLEMRYLQASDRWLTDYHLQGQEIIGKSHYVVFPDIPDRWKAVHRRVLAGAVESCDEDPFPRADGTTDWLQWEARPWHQAGGQIGGLIFFTQVITERKRTEMARDRSLSLTRATLESTADGILVVNFEGKIDIYNRHFAEMWRLPDDVLAAKDDARALQCVLDQLSEPEKFIAKVRHLYSHPSATSSDTLDFKDGRVFERYSRPQLLGEQVVGRVWSFRDITERRRTEVALRDSEEKFRAVFAQSPLAIVLTTMPEGRVADANAAAEALMGLKLADVRGKTTIELNLWVDPDDRGRYLQLLQQKGVMHDFEVKMRRSDGVVITVLYHGRVVRIGGQDYTLNSFIDITERKRADEALRLASAAMEAADNGIFVTDRDGVIQWINPAMTTISGYAAGDAVGRKPNIYKSKVHDTAFYRQLWETILDGRVWHGEITNRRKDGELYISDQTITPVNDASGEISHFVSVQQDITLRKKLEEQFRQSQKMETIGQLSGGVAHDFNNMLTAIIGHLGLLRGNPQITPEIAESLAEIGAAANRAATLTSQLLAFSRRQVMSTSALDLNALVMNLTKMLRRILGETVVMQLDYAPEQLTFNGDSVMMEQVLVNLSVNARDAMPNGGTLRIMTRVETRIPPLLDGQAKTGESTAFVRLSVCDTGTGILPEHKARIFEPFFTTKDVGKGTGLGLATVFGIVQQHLGWIEVDSEVGQGTSFHIFLPRLAASPLAVAPKSAAPAARGRNELVLLVEDEPSVQELGMRALSGYGYRVLTASNGPAALEVWAKHKTEIQLLLTDMIMPGGISGIQLASQLLQEMPSLKVIYSSGYSAEIAGREIKLTDGINFLAKPYELDLLFRTVRTALDSRKPSRQPF